MFSEQKWWQGRLEAEKEAAGRSITQPAGVKVPFDTSVAKKGGRQGRAGAIRGQAVVVTKASAPAPVRGRKAVRPPAKTPAAR